VVLALEPLLAAVAPMFSPVIVGIHMLLCLPQGIERIVARLAVELWRSVCSLDMLLSIVLRLERGIARRAAPVPERVHVLRNGMPVDEFATASLTLYHVDHP
jgi:hypothetical protein